MRNIVNILELDDLLKEFYERYNSGNNRLVSSERLLAFLNGNIRNYCLRKAPIKRDFFFYWRDKNFLEKEIFKKSDGPYHRVDLKSMFFRIQSVLDFVCYSGYGHQKDLSTLNFEIAEKKHEQWLKHLRKNNAKIEGKIEIVKTYADEYYMALLEDKTSYEREGVVMNHCVGSYFDRSLSEIYSLRSNQGKSLVTIEVKNNIIIQYLMHSNQPVSANLKPYLNEFAKEKGFKFRYSITPRTTRFPLIFGTSFVLFGLAFTALRLKMGYTPDEEPLPGYFSVLLWVAMFGWMGSGLGLIMSVGEVFHASTGSIKIVDQI